MFRSAAARLENRRLTAASSRFVMHWPKHRDLALMGRGRRKGAILKFVAATTYERTRFRRACGPHCSVRQ